MEAWFYSVLLCMKRKSAFLTLSKQACNGEQANKRKGKEAWRGRGGEKGRGLYVC